MVYPIITGIVSITLNSTKSLQVEQKQNKNWLFLKSGLSMCVAQTILYLGGTIWLSITTGTSFQATLAIAVYPFVLLDIVKIAFCVAAIVPLRSRLLSIDISPLHVA